jgi:hypothetical protein
MPCNKRINRLAVVLNWQTLQRSICLAGELRALCFVCFGWTGKAVHPKMTTCCFLLLPDDSQFCGGAECGVAHLCIQTFDQNHPTNKRRSQNTVNCHRMAEAEKRKRKKEVTSSLSSAGSKSYSMESKTHGRQIKRKRKEGRRIMTFCIVSCCCRIYQRRSHGRLQRGWGLTQSSGSWHR